MSMQSKFCEKCNEITPHREVIKQKPSKYDQSRKGKFIAFLEGFFSPSKAIPGGVALELTDRYLECVNCKHRTLDNKGDEFQ